MCWQKQQAASARGEEPEDEFTLSMWLTTLSESYDKLRKKVKKAGGAEQYNANTKYTDAVAVAVLPPLLPACSGAVLGASVSRFFGSATTRDAASTSSSGRWAGTCRVWVSVNVPTGTRGHRSHQPAR